MVSTSIVIASHNEGEALIDTITSIMRRGYNYEIVICDDASNDKSIQKIKKKYEYIKIKSHSERRGISCSKNDAALASKGKILIFLDAHCNAGPDSINTLSRTVEEHNGKAIIMPSICHLNCDKWENDLSKIGNGYGFSLEDFETYWISLNKLKKVGEIYISPSIIGCCVAMSKELYNDVYGFDCDMREFGVEDIDFGLKAWMCGYEILHYPKIVIGHRFVNKFNYSVSCENIIHNKIRMARKNFNDNVWLEWLSKIKKMYDDDLWNQAWILFEERRSSVEYEREYLIKRKCRDEYMYAKTFNLNWPLK